MGGSRLFMLWVMREFLSPFPFPLSPLSLFHPPNRNRKLKTIVPDMDNTAITCLAGKATHYRKQ